MASAKPLFHLSVLLLVSFTALAYNEEVSFAQAPHYSHWTHPPVAAPKPGHHHKGGHNHHPHPHPKPPTQPPVKAPTPPTKPPTHSPTKAPMPPTKAPMPPTKAPMPPAKAPTPSPKYPPMVKKPVAVQGVVYCKACKYTGVDTLTGATALANATVKIVCIKDKFHMVQKATTDKNGFFYMMPKKLTTAGIGICKVVLAKSPSAKCSAPTNLHGGVKGALLIRPSAPTIIHGGVTAPSKIALFTVGPFAYEAPKKCY